MSKAPSSETFERGRDYVEVKAKDLILARNLEDLADRHKVFLSVVMLLRVCFPEREATISKIEDWEWELYIKSGRGLKPLKGEKIVRSPRAGIMYECRSEREDLHE